jgi:hypothetical protein
MSNPSGPDQPDEVTQQAAVAGDTEDGQQAEAVTDPGQEPERRFTAPSNFDAGATQKIEPQADPATEVMPPVPKSVVPQLIPGRSGSAKPLRTRRSWGWVVALLLVIAALVAVAILGTVLITRNSASGASGAHGFGATVQAIDTAARPTA